MPRNSFYHKNARVEGTFTGKNPLITEAGLGVKAGSGVSVVEQGDGVVHKTILTIVNLVVAMVDATTNGSQGTQKIYDFPEGLLSIMGASMNLTISRVGTALAAGAAIVAAIGTVVPGVDATLTSTEANIIPSTVGTLTAGAGAPKGKSTGGTTQDGTTTPIDAILNFAVADADSSGNDSLLVNGTVTIVWTQMGDV